MVKGTTRGGFKFSIDPKNVKDMRVVELAAKATREPLYMPELASRILGESQKEALYKHLEDSKGRVDPERFGEELEDIMGAIDKDEETKN